MTREDLILRCMLAYIQRSPPPVDVTTIDVRPMSTKMAQARYEHMAAYIDQQLTLHEPRVTDLDISRCPTLRALSNGDRA